MSKANDARYATQTSLTQRMKDTYMHTLHTYNMLQAHISSVKSARNLHSTVRIRAAQHNQIGGHAYACVDMDMGMYLAIRARKA